MAITTTTLTSAIVASDLVFAVASATGINNPSFAAASSALVGNVTILQVEQEFMLVLSVTATFISVQRGYFGTAAVAHAANSVVFIAAAPGDVGTLTEFIVKSFTISENLGNVTRPATILSGLTDAVAAGVAAYYVIKSTAANLMTLAAPTAAQDGNYIEIWSDTAFAHTLTATGLLAGGTALKNVGTFPAFRGAGIVLCARNLVYHVVSSGNGNVASFVVLT